MTTYVLTDAKLYVEEHDISAKWKSGKLDCKQVAKESTQFSADSRAYTPGLKSHAFSITGFQDNTTTLNPDNELYGMLGSAERLITVCPTDGTDGEIAYAFMAAQTGYSPIGGTVGDMAGFTLNATGNGRLLRGTILKNCAANVTTNGTGTAYELGDASATETVYAALHVYEFDGGTLDLAIQSDDAEGMASATERIGFTNATDVTTEWATASGAITDTWWRVSWTYDGTACKFVVTMMIA